MEKKIVIMLLNLNLQHPGTLGSPFFQASVAAAMDLEVEVYFAGPTIRLLMKGFAELLYPGSSQEKSLYAFMRDAHDAGARFYACAGGMTEHGLSIEGAIPELDGIRGGGAFIDTITEDHVVTLTY